MNMHLCFRQRLFAYRLNYALMRGCTAEPVILDTVKYGEPQETYITRRPAVRLKLTMRPLPCLVGKIAVADPRADVRALQLNVAFDPVTTMCGTAALVRSGEVAAVKVAFVCSPLAGFLR